MSVDGARRSPLMLMPDRTPVTVGKKTPKTRNHEYPSWYFGQRFSTKFPLIQPSKPFSVIELRFYSRHILEWYDLPWSSPIKLPTMKSNADMSRIISKMNCSLMTHLTPATLMQPSNRTAAVAKPRIAHLLPSSPTKPAMDSPKPMTLSAQPTAWPKQ